MATKRKNTSDNISLKCPKISDESNASSSVLALLTSSQDLSSSLSSSATTSSSSSLSSSPESVVFSPEVNQRDEKIE